MKRILAITILTCLATIAGSCLIRGELGFGGEMIIPVLAGFYAIITEDEDEEESRA